MSSSYTTATGHWAMGDYIQHRHSNWADQTLQVWVKHRSGLQSEVMAIPLYDLHDMRDRETFLGGVFYRLTKELETYLETLKAMECE